MENSGGVKPPKAVWQLAQYFVMVSVLAGFVSLCLLIIATATIFHLTETNDTQPELVNALAMGVASLIFWLIRMGFINRVRLAYISCFIIFFPMGLEYLLFQRIGGDWFSNKFADPETMRWFGLKSLT